MKNNLLLIIVLFFINFSLSAQNTNRVINTFQQETNAMVTFQKNLQTPSLVSFPRALLMIVASFWSNTCNRCQPQDLNGTSCDGEFWWGSNFGNEIDIVAPGVKIFTTDISGSNGYNTGDYKSDFNGTSSACPNAAGVAALVLSVNPNFTQAQVREILETTTDKIGNTPYNLTFQNYGATQTWNNEVGYGRLNAYSADNT